jgi:hypothetical protein
MIHRGGVSGTISFPSPVKPVPCKNIQLDRPKIREQHTILRVGPGRTDVRTFYLEVAP